MITAACRLLFFLPVFIFGISAAAQEPAIDSFINPAACRQIVETLAADSFLGRYTGTETGQKAAQFIADEFRKAGCSPGGNRGSFFMPFTVYRGDTSNRTNNVVAALPGKSKPHQWVIFSAHYDHVGTKRTNPINFLPEKGKPEPGDTIYNGANDNASGVSALILLARYFAQAGNNERTIVFIAFSGEELGLFGSRNISDRMNNYDSIVAMINMDMLGVPVSRKIKTPYLTGAGYSDLRSILNNRLYERSPEKFGKNFFRADPYKAEKLFTRSDNYWFAMKGIPAHTIIATHPRDRYYHSLNDESRSLDYDLLARIIEALAIASGSLTDGSQAPARINPLKIMN
jgi:hypothetical protein